MRRKRIKSDFDFKAIIPTIISSIILILLIVALVFVIRFKVEDYVGDIDTTENVPEMVSEDTDYEITDECAVNKKDLVKDVNIGFEVAEAYEGYEFTENEEYEDVYVDTIYVVITGIPDGVTPKAFDEDGNEYEVTDPDGETYSFEPSQDMVVSSYKLYLYLDDCDQQIAKYTIKVPILNPYRSTPGCKMYPEYEYCSELLYEKLLPYNEFTEGIHAYALSIASGDMTTSTTSDLKEDGLEDFTIRISSTTSKTENTKKNKNNYMKYIIVGVSIVLLASLIVIIIIIVKKRRRA